MRPAAAHLADPLAIPIALLATAGLWLLGQPWWLAVPAGIVVLGVHLGSAAWFAKRRPAPPVEGVAADWQKFGLTRKEIEVVPLVARGLPYKQIARMTFNSERTIENHVDHIKKKLDVHSRAEITAFAMRHQLLSPADLGGGPDSPK